MNSKSTVSQKPAVAKRGRGRPRADGMKLSARENILELALKEFGRNGFEGTQIGEIAKRAGVAKPLIHYHFASKDKLWRSSVEHAMGKLMKEFATLPFEVNGLEASAMLTICVRRFALFCMQNRAVTDIVIQEIGRDNERAHWLRETYLKPSYALTGAFLQRALAGSELRDVEPAHLLSIISGAVNSFFAFSDITQDMLGEGELSDAAANRHAELVVDILLNGLRPR